MCQWEAHSDASAKNNYDNDICGNDTGESLWCDRALANDFRPYTRSPRCQEGSRGFGRRWNARYRTCCGRGVRRAPRVGTSYAACGDRRVGDGAHPGGHDADGGGQPAFVLVAELVDSAAESGFWIGRTPRGCPARRWRKGLCRCGFFSPDSDLGFDGLVGDGRAGGT